MKDELKEQFEDALRSYENDGVSILAGQLVDIVKDVIAPELEKARILNDKIGHLVATDIAVLVEKARKWDRFVGIQSCNDCPAYPECPCDYTNCPALKIENALSKEAT